MAPPQNYIKQGLWIIFSNLVMISERDTAMGSLFFGI